MYRIEGDIYTPLDKDITLQYKSLYVAILSQNKGQKNNTPPHHTQTTTPSRTLIHILPSTYSSTQQE